MSTKWQWDIKTHQSQWTSSQACKQYRGEGGWRQKKPPMLSVAAASVTPNDWKKKTIKGNKAYNLHSHTGAYMYPKKTINERHMHPKEHYCSSTPSSQDTPPAKSPPRVSSSSKMWHLCTVDWVSLTGSCHWNWGIMTLVTAGVVLGGSHTKGSRSGRWRL